MTAREKRRRKDNATAREVAERFGVSIRTVQRLIAEPRSEFLARAAARRAEAVQLRNEGLKYAEIAERMDITTGTVSRLIHDARVHGEFPARTAALENAS